MEQPITREEHYLAAIAGEEVQVPTKPLTRVEHYLAKILEGGSGADLSVIAPEYSAESTYAEGDLCTHDGKLYKANQDIDTAEEWDETHWTETTVSDEIVSIDPEDIADAVNDWLDDHPEATTTVEDGSITKAKLDSNLQGTVDDVDVLKSAIQTKADKDGSYESMTVGNAEQLVATVGIEDSTPYLLRTTGGAADIGDRVKLSEITGGTVAWNQIIENGNFSDTTTWSDYQCSHSIVDGVATITPTGTTSRIYQVVKKIFNHKYLMMASFKGTSGEGNALLSWYGGVNKFVPFTGGWQNVALLLDDSFDSEIPWQLHYGSSSNANNTPYQIKNAVCYDLTQMFGSTIADYIYSLETATAGAGVAQLKAWGFCTKPYYAYDAGSLLSVETTAHREVGFNLFDESDDGETAGYYRFWDMPIGKTNQLYMTLKDTGATVDMTGISFGFAKEISASGVPEYVWVLQSGALQSNHTNVTIHGVFCGAVFLFPNTTATLDKMRQKYNINVNLHWDGERDGEYEPYEEHTYPLDDVELRGIPKLDANNNLYYDGDEYASDGTVTRKYGIVDLGTLNWTYEQSAQRGNYFWTSLPLLKAGASLLCDKYMFIGARPSNYSAVDKAIALEGVSAQLSTYIDIVDSAYTDAATFKTAMSGVYLVYELATPTTEEADPYQETQICNDFGIEEFVDTRTVPIPVGYTALYQPNLRAKLEMAPDSPSDGDGDYIVRQTNGENAYVKLVIPTELPTAPTTDGTYHLKCTVASGTATLSWESDT